MPKFREVTGQFVGYTPDTADAGITPDRVPMNGRVTFTPQFTGGLISFPKLVPPEFAHPEPIEARIVDGFVMVEIWDGETLTLQPLSLMVTVDDEATQNWSWRADFTEIYIGDAVDPTPISPWTFRVPDGVGKIDLTELLPVTVLSGVELSKGPRGAGLERIVAVDGQLRFEYTDGQTTLVPVPDSIPGPPGEDGAPGTPGAKGDPGTPGDVRFEGINPGITVRTDDVIIGDVTVPTDVQLREATQHSPQEVTSDGKWRLAETDDTGRISRAVDDQGRTWLTPHPDSPGIVDPQVASQFISSDAPEYAWVITDEFGKVALGVRADGTVQGADSLQALPYDVILLVGQSNMQGRGSRLLDRDPIPGVDQFPAANKPDAGRIVPAVDPLGHTGTIIPSTPASLAIPFARKYRQEHPGRRVLLVPAAAGDTAFSSTTGMHWDWTVTTGQPLAPRAVEHCKAALAAAGPRARFAGILWHQGEGDLGIADQYAEKLDGLINYFRTELQAPDVPVVVGQMSLDRPALAARTTVDAAHQQTPARVERTAFAPSPRGLHNPGDPTHFSTRALDLMGHAFYTGLCRAAFNVAGTLPLGPEKVRAERVGDIVRVSWDPAWARVTDYLVEWRTGDGEWSSAGVEHAPTLGLTATIIGPWATEVRVSSLNSTGQSPAVTAFVAGAAVQRETGLRNIAALMPAGNGWTGTPTVTVMRADAGVMVAVTGLARDAAGTNWVNLVQLPTGFQPPDTLYSRDFAGGRWRILTTGWVQVQNPGTALNYFSLAFLTRQAWPTTYPGVTA